MVHKTNVYEYKILRFWANPQKYQALVPVKNSHLKVALTACGPSRPPLN